MITLHVKITVMIGLLLLSTVFATAFSVELLQSEECISAVEGTNTTISYRI